MMRFVLFVAVLLSIESSAQEMFISVHGKIMDSQSKEPVPYASVYVKENSAGAITNEDGKFLFHVPARLRTGSLVISAIGYENFESLLADLVDKENVIALKRSAVMLHEVVVTSSKKELSAKEIVKKAVAGIADNYPMKPFAIEGFFRDLQIENDKPVELLDAAVKFTYKDYNPGYEGVEILEVRRSYNKRHPVNGVYDRQNSIIDLMEDNYVKHRVGPIHVKGWDFTTDSVLTYNARQVYRITGISDPSETTTLYIDTENFSILKLELRNQMINGEFYRRYLNLPDPYGLQETSFYVVFEFREFEGKMYLKYQREEDSYNLFNKTTHEIILRQSFVKELFVNNIVTRNVDGAEEMRMNMTKSVESQAKTFNADFWKHYNAPVETLKDGKIIKALQLEP